MLPIEQKDQNEGEREEIDCVETAADVGAEQPQEQTEGEQDDQAYEQD